MTFKSEVMKLAKSEEEYNDLFQDESDLVAFVRRNTGISSDAMAIFIERQVTKGFNERQEAYLKSLLNYIIQNGRFARSDLLKEELFFDNIFDSVTINALLNDIEGVL